MANLILARLVLRIAWATPDLLPETGINASFRSPVTLRVFFAVIPLFSCGCVVTCELRIQQLTVPCRPGSGGEPLLSGTAAAE
jgi:hypothetical protein